MMPDVATPGARHRPLPPAVAASRRLRAGNGERSAVAQRGSQSLELALALPIVALLGVGVLMAGMVGVEVTAAHAAAREAARAAAAGEDVHDRLARVGLAEVGAVRVEPSPEVAAAGEVITVEVVVPSRVLTRVGADVELRARAAAASEPSTDAGR